MPETPVDLESVDLIPFENLNRDEMISHLWEYHQIHPYRSKEPKAGLTEMHHRGEARPSKVAHNHLALGDGSSYRDLTPPLDKPLNAAERKALVDLVNNDFSALKQEILHYSQDMAQARQAEIRQEWAGKGRRKQEFLSKAIALRAKHREALATLTERADTAGVQLVVVVPYGEPTVAVKGLQAALQAAEHEVSNETHRALLTWERQRLTALRLVLLAGISAEGLALLGTVPTAKELMSEAIQHQQAITAQSYTDDDFEYDDPED